MDETALFAQAMADVRPLKQASKVSTKPLINEPTPGLGERREAAVAQSEDHSNFLSTGASLTGAPLIGPHDTIGFRRPGVQHGVYAKLRRGQYPPQDCLDLHRRTVEQARLDLWSFVQCSSAAQLRSVMVLHGKGHRSPNGGVLKGFVAHWLKSLPEVLAYHSAQPRHGGVGALYVLLKKSPQARDDNRERYAKKRYD